MLLEILSRLSHFRSTSDVDAVDQLHHMGTVAVFMAFAALTGMNQYVGDPIHCWVPAQFPDHHQAYAENVCWLSQMYYMPINEEMAHFKKDRMQKEIGFYRWVIAIFLLQCLLFKFPNMLWTELKGYSGLNIQKMVSMADEATTSSQDVREKTISDISMILHKWLWNYRVRKYSFVVKMKEKMSGVLCFVLGKRQGTYLIGLYLSIKLLNIINVLIQFVILTAILKFNYWTYGLQVLQHLGGKLVDIDHFPRVVMCDFEIRQMQNIQTFSLQCVLSINLFIEKIFAVIWFWLFVLAIISIINFIMCSYNILFKKQREHFIEKYLIILGDTDCHQEVTIFKKFVHSYLRDDGLFLLRTVGNNSSEIIVMEIIKKLWTIFKKDNWQKRDTNGNAARAIVKEK